MATTNNTFTKGINSDINDLNMSPDTLTTALNATISTFNGSEGILLNDMGNCKIINKSSNGEQDIAYLPNEFVPIGSIEHGGIIYYSLVSKEEYLDEKTQTYKRKCLIGSFPSPNYDKFDENIPSDLLYLYQPLHVGYLDGNDIFAPLQAKVKIRIMNLGQIKDDPGDSLEEDLTILFQNTFDTTRSNEAFTVVSYKYPCVKCGPYMMMIYPLGSDIKGGFGSLLTRNNLANYETKYQGNPISEIQEWRVPTLEEFGTIVGGLTNKTSYSNPNGLYYTSLENALNILFPFGGMSVIKKEVVSQFTSGQETGGSNTNNTNNPSSVTTSTGNDGDESDIQVLSDDDKFEIENNSSANANASSGVGIANSTLTGGTSGTVSSSSSASSSLSIDPNNYDIINQNDNCYIWVKYPTDDGDYKILRFPDMKLLEEKNEIEGDFSKYTEEYSYAKNQLIPDLQIVPESTDGSFPNKGKSGEECEPPDNKPLKAEVLVSENGKVLVSSSSSNSGIYYYVKYKNKKTKTLVDEDSLWYLTKEAAELGKEKIILDFLNEYYNDDGLHPKTKDIDEYKYATIERSIMTKRTLEKFKANAFLICKYVEYIIPIKS